MDFAIAKMSTKGQIVIPSDLRKDIKTGDEFLIVKGNNSIILKKVKDLKKHLQNDIAFAKAVDKACKTYDKQKKQSMSKKELLAEFDSW